MSDKEYIQQLEKELEQLTSDLTQMMAIGFAQQEYLKKIGKLEEAKTFVKKFIRDLEKEDTEKWS